MAIAYVNKGNFASGNGAITPGIPSGFTIGNLLLLLVESANEDVTAPSGWTVYTGGGVGTAGAAGGVALNIFWRIATSGQAAPTVADTGNHTTAIIFEFSGVEPGAPFAQNSFGTVSTASFSFTSLTTVYNQAFMVYCIGNDRDIASTSNFSGWSSSLNNLTVRHDQTVSTQAGGGLAMLTGTAPNNAGSSTGSVSGTNGAAVNLILIILELRPKIPLASTISTGTTKTADLKKLGLRSVISSGSVPFFGVKYGCIYNWYAVADSRQLAPSGWHVVSKYDFETLLIYLDPNAYFQNNIAAPALMEPGTPGQWWIEGENIATNTAKFNARGGAGRGQYGFDALGGTVRWWNSEEWNSTHACFSQVVRNDPEFMTAAFGLNNTNPKWNGYAVRLIKDSTTLSHGQSGFMTGNDGKIYRTICIGTQEYLADNLCETKFRNGENIPGDSFTNEAWYALTTAGFCFPNNDSSVAYGTYIPFPYVLGALKGTGALLLNLLSGQPLRPSIVYGFLYNWYAATDARNIANTGWSVPTLAQLEDIWKYYSPSGNNGDNLGGKAMKETGTTYWNNNLGTNESKLNGRGSGNRLTTFYDQKYAAAYWSKTEYNSTRGQAGGISTLSDVFTTNGIPEKYMGSNIRLRKDSTTLNHGETGYYFGNDGTRYKTVCVGTVEWLAENLIETRYRNGDYIPHVPVQADWNVLTTGAYSIYDNTQSNAFTTASGDSLIALLKGKGSLLSTIASGNKFITGGYGFLYNCYVVRNTANIANTGWHVPSLAEWQALATYLGGESVAGGKLKETGYDHWLSPNSGATNETGFNLSGGALRDPSSGNFYTLKGTSTHWSTTAYFTTYGTIMSSAYNTTDFIYGGGGTHLRSGCSIRLIKDSTSLQNGQTGSYTGNDGKQYSSICINGVEYLSHNLIETKYRDGSSIPEVKESSEWIALTTHAFCAHSNDWANAYFSGFLDGVIGTIEFSGQAASLIATILSQSGITASITGKGKLLANADGSTTLLAQIEGGSFIPIITFF